MPRRRMVDPQIWRNRKFGKLSDAGRLLFIGIFSQADDDGRLKASPDFLMANIFPYDKDKTEENIHQLRDQCAKLGLIRIYTNGNEEYLDIPGWLEHQQIRKDRYQASKLPSFEESQELVNHLATNDNRLATNDIPNIIKSSLVKSKPPIIPLKKGEEAVKEKTSRFDLFWEAYPKKRNKGQAERAFKKAAPDEQLMAVILSAIERAKKSAQWLKDNGQYIPYPATWLNARGWEDEFEEDQKGGAGGVEAKRYARARGPIKAIRGTEPVGPEDEEVS